MRERSPSNGIRLPDVGDTGGPGSGKQGDEATTIPGVGCVIVRSRAALP
jgi:hypothetical protein